MKKSDNVCCPPFDPSPWEDKEHEWVHKKFIKDKVFCLFNVPITFGIVLSRMYAKIKKSGVHIQEWLCLSDHVSRWGMDLYVAVDRDVPGSNNIELSGRYISNVYEGEFKNMKKWMQDFSNSVKAKGLELGKTYQWYTTCPRCAKKHGKNYVVMFGEVE